MNMKGLLATRSWFVVFVKISPVYTSDLSVKREQERIRFFSRIVCFHHQEVEVTRILSGSFIFNSPEGGEGYTSLFGLIWCLCSLNGLIRLILLFPQKERVQGIGDVQSPLSAPTHYPPPQRRDTEDESPWVRGRDTKVLTVSSCFGPRLTYNQGFRRWTFYAYNEGFK